MVFLNGTIVGVTSRPNKILREIQLIRRAGRIPEFVSICINEEHRAVYVSSDAGRLTRPLIIVENGEPRVKQYHIDKLRNGKFNFNDFIRQGRV